MATPQNTQLGAYASGTNTAGSTFNGTAEPTSNAVSVRYSGTITNGGTAPTIAAQANFQVCYDAGPTTWYTVATATASLTINAVTTFDFFRLYPNGFTRVQITGNTGQSVTYAIASGYITAIT